MQKNQEKQLQETMLLMMKQMQEKNQEDAKKLREEIELKAKLEREKLLSELQALKQEKPQVDSALTSSDQLHVPSQAKPVLEPVLRPKPVVNEPKKHEPEIKKKPEPLDQSMELKVAKFKETQASCLYAKLFYNNDDLYKLTISGKQVAEKMNITISVKCLSNPSIKIKEERLDENSVREVLKATSLSAILPYFLQAKGIKSVAHISKYAILPFVQVSSEEEGNKLIEIWVHAVGIIKDNGFQVTFLNAVCHMGLHHINDQNMRISFTYIDTENKDTLFIDMDFDRISFMKEFPLTNIEKYKESSEEEWLSCFEPVTVEFLDKIDSALTEIESYLKKNPYRSIFISSSSLGQNSQRNIDIGESSRVKADTVDNERNQTRKSFRDLLQNTL
eukprot:TRINITY_DN3398_c0_g1_i3.p1 TRINITY_DN3398_c0_g1~~TRINITY_DN3398_c0_g1_i3.p1  ORF type:complete len:390 (+),score=72.91 TRINITY_DN3398_c0_g1_i3:503-1672(+)